MRCDVAEPICPSLERSLGQPLRRHHSSQFHPHPVPQEKPQTSFSQESQSNARESLALSRDPPEVRLPPLDRPSPHFPAPEGARGP